MSSRPVSPFVTDEPSAAAAFARRLAELTSLPERDVLQVNLDIPSVVATVLGALPRIRGNRAIIEKQLPSFDLRLIDELEDYALALHHAHGECLASGRPVRFPPALLAEARTVRLRMLTCLKACAASAAVDGSFLERLRGTAGNKDLATDLTLLVSVLRGNPRLFEVQYLVTPAVCQRALELATQVLACVGRRELSPHTARLLVDLRARAFSLVIRAYSEARRAIRYLRLGDEEEEIAPSLFTRRSRGRRRTGAKAGDPAEVKPVDDAQSDDTAEPWSTGGATEVATVVEWIDQLGLTRRRP